MTYIVGERYYFRYTRGWQTQGELIKVLPDEKYLMYSERHGYFTVDKKNLDDHNKGGIKMREYLVKAFAVNGYVTRKIVAKDEDEACKLFVDVVMMETDNYDIEFDDFKWKDLGPAPVFIDSDPNTDNSYFVSDNLPTITVGELIKELSKFDSDAKVYLKNDSEVWNVFRGLTIQDIEEGEIYN